MNSIAKVMWQDIASRSLRDRTILLDIDGVLMADGEDTVADDVLPYVEKLIRDNDVWIVSNTLRTERRRAVAKKLGVPWADTPHRKPSRRVLEVLDRNSDKPLVVIGDKYLTDGLFAHRIGAEVFLIKERKRSSRDRWYIGLSYLIDDVVYWIVSRVLRLTRD